jgi:protein SCO1/2
MCPRPLALALVAAGAACAGAGRPAGAVPARDAAPMPRVVLTAQDGTRAAFPDVVRDRVVVLAFGYLRCTGSCAPTAGRLLEVQRQLGDRSGRDVVLLTVSLDPEHDTPERLARHAAGLGAGRGWTFLTGAPADVDELRGWFGLVDRRDPAAPRTSHAALLVVGDASANRWYVLPALGEPREVIRLVERLLARRPHARLAAGG